MSCRIGQKKTSRQIQQLQIDHLKLINRLMQPYPCGELQLFDLNSAQSALKVKGYRVRRHTPNTYSEPTTDTEI